MKDCPHHPHCGSQYTRWSCHQRTELEQAVKDGDIDRGVATRLLQKQGLPMTPESKVYKGQPRPTLWKDFL
jgi:hypothetical protein